MAEFGWKWLNFGLILAESGWILAGPFSSQIHFGWIYGWIWLKMAENGWIWLKMAESWLNGWKWLNFGWKWLKRAEIWLKMAEFNQVAGIQPNFGFGWKGLNFWQIKRGTILVENGAAVWRGLEKLSQHQSRKTAILNQTLFWLGGSICPEAKISYFQSLAWCLLQKSFKGQSFFCNNMPQENPH